MLTIAVLHGRGSRDEIAHQLAPLGTLEWYTRATALVARATAGGLDAVIVEFDDERGQSIVGTIVELAALCPTLPILIHDQVNGATLKKLLATFPVGLRMAVAVR